MSACRRTEQKIRDYLEDLLPESERSEIRKHLLCCSECAACLQRVGSFTSDLRHSVFAPLPDHQMETLLQEMEKRESFPWRRAWLVARGGVIIVAAVIVFGLIFRGVGSLQSHFESERKKELQKQIEGSMVIQELKNIDKRLSRYSSKNQNAEKSQLESVQRNVMSLRPFHWHLDFDSASARDQYVEKLRSLKAKFLYVSKETPVLELLYQDFVRLTELTPDYPGVLSKEKLVELESLPIPEKPVQVSFYFRYPNRPHKPHHWHLKFTLPNRFEFEGQVKPEFDFLFSREDLWILNVNPDEFVHFVQMVQKTQGVEADWGEQGQNPYKSNVSLPVMITLSDA